MPAVPTIGFAAALARAPSPTPCGRPPRGTPTSKSLILAAARREAARSAACSRNGGTSFEVLTPEPTSPTRSPYGSPSGSAGAMRLPRSLRSTTIVGVRPL